MSVDESATISSLKLPLNPESKRGSPISIRNLRANPFTRAKSACFARHGVGRSNELIEILLENCSSVHIFHCPQATIICLSHTIEEYQSRSHSFFAAQSSSKMQSSCVTFQKQIHKLFPCVEEVSEKRILFFTREIN